MRLQGNGRGSRAKILAACALTALLWSGGAVGEQAHLKRIQTIQLKGPDGRLDHMALDAEHARLFVANMANSSLDVIDLKQGTLLKQIPGQKGIQGIAYAADLNRIFVGVGEAGVCNVYDGRDLSLLKSLPFPDADNVRYDRRTQRVYVAHAEKALAMLNGKTLEILADIELPGPPESFQLEKTRPRLYLNTPKPSQVAVIDTESNKVIDRFPLTLAQQNYPMALDESDHRLFIGCRQKPRLVVLDSESGKEVTSVAIPGDTDDVFYDAKRKRIYASCGAGFLAVVRQIDADRYEMLEKIPTVKVARTSLFDPDTGRLYLIVPKHAHKPGPQIWVYQARD
jgi:DNA-binding beta-propeller fold protein YncE